MALTKKRARNDLRAGWRASFGSCGQPPGCAQPVADPCQPLPDSHRYLLSHHRPCGRRRPCMLSTAGIQHLRLSWLDQQVSSPPCDNLAAATEHELMTPVDLPSGLHRASGPACRPLADRYRAARPCNSLDSAITNPYAFILTGSFFDMRRSRRHFVGQKPDKLF